MGQEAVVNRFNGWCQIMLTFAAFTLFVIGTWYGYGGRS